MRKWLTDARESKGFTLAKLASELGISESYLSLIERGMRKSKLDVELVYKLHKILGIPMLEIIRLEGADEDA